MCCRGFTLPELLVALAILAIGAGFSVFASRDFNDRRLLVTAAESLTAALRFAHRYALLSGRAVTLCASDDSARCNADNFAAGWIIFAEPADSADSKPDDGERILSVRHAMHSSLRVQTRNISGHLRFLPAGKAHRAGRISICHKTNSRQRFGVIITTAGLVRHNDSDDLCEENNAQTS